MEPTNPVPFPNPIIRRCLIRAAVVDGSRKNILESGSGRFYQLDQTIKDTIFGRVLRAVEIVSNGPDSFGKIDHLVAIKVYSKGRLRSLQGRTQENPLMEITALQYLGNSHPHVVGQIECCSDDEHIFSVMRLCSGGELFDYIDDEGPMSESQAKMMFRQLIEGLKMMHSVGVGHRDLSMENILFDASTGIFSIIDMGMCLRHAATMVGFAPMHVQPVCGKKNYVSPEVLRQDPVFSPMLTDIWAAGVILFMALTGVPPVDKATTADERYVMICNGHLGTMIQAWGIDLSVEVVDLMQRILHPDPGARLTLAQIQAHPWML
jgi:serine/threonine protein kinase